MEECEVCELPRNDEHVQRTGDGGCTGVARHKGSENAAKEAQGERGDESDGGRVSEDEDSEDEGRNPYGTKVVTADGNTSEEGDEMGSESEQDEVRTRREGRCRQKDELEIARKKAGTWTELRWLVETYHGRRWRRGRVETVRITWEPKL